MEWAALFLDTGLEATRAVTPGDLAGPLAGSVAAIIATIVAAVGVLYRDLKKDRERALGAHNADRERYRADRKEWTRELLAAREERAACRAELAATQTRIATLEETVRLKMEAAQPRDSHGRFVDEAGPPYQSNPKT